MKNNNTGYSGKGYTTSDWKYAKKNLKNEPFREDVHHSLQDFGRAESRLFMEKSRHEVFFSDNQQSQINLANAFDDEIILRLFLKEVILSLTQVQQDRYQLHADGYLLREIAAMQGVSINAVSKSVIAAREKIKNIFKEFYFEG